MLSPLFDIQPDFPCAGDEGMHTPGGVPVFNILPFSGPGKEGVHCTALPSSILRLCVQEDGRLTWDKERITCSQPCSSSVQGGGRWLRTTELEKAPKLGALPLPSAVGMLTHAAAPSRAWTTAHGSCPMTSTAVSVFQNSYTTLTYIPHPGALQLD